MIETKRLIMRQWHDEDIIQFAEINQNAEVMEYMPKLLSTEETMHFYERIVSEHEKYGYGLYAVELKNTGEFIGYTGFHHFALKPNFHPESRLGGESRESTGIKDMPQKRQKPASITPRRKSCSKKYIHLLQHATIGQNA